MDFKTCIFFANKASFLQFQNLTMAIIAIILKENLAIKITLSLLEMRYMHQIYIERLWNHEQELRHQKSTSFLGLVPTLPKYALLIWKQENVKVIKINNQFITHSKIITKVDVRSIQRILKSATNKFMPKNINWITMIIILKAKIVWKISCNSKHFIEKCTCLDQRAKMYFNKENLSFYTAKYTSYFYILDFNILYFCIFDFHNFLFFIFVFMFSTFLILRVSDITQMNFKSYTISWIYDLFNFHCRVEFAINSTHPKYYN